MQLNTISDTFTPNQSLYPGRMMGTDWLITDWSKASHLTNFCPVRYIFISGQPGPISQKPYRCYKMGKIQVLLEGGEEIMNDR